MINVFLFVFISNGDGQREITYQSVDCFRKQITTHFLSKIKKTKSSRVNGPKKGPGIFGSLMNMCANQSLGVNLNYAYKTGAFLTEMNYALYIYIYNIISCLGGPNTYTIAAYVDQRFRGTKSGPLKL